MNIVSSPHAHGARPVGQVMMLVMLALLPAFGLLLIVTGIIAIIAAFRVA